MSKILDKIFSIRSYFEGLPLSVGSWFVGVSAVFMVRFFLEAMTSPSSTRILATDASSLLHYYVFFMAFAFVFMIFLFYALPSWRKAIPGFTVAALASIFIAPIIHFVMSPSYGVAIAYVFEPPLETLISLLTFFGPLSGSGISLGIRIEVVIILLSIFGLVYVESRKISRSLLYTALLYLIIFFFLALPSIINIVAVGFGVGGYFGVPLDFFASSVNKSLTVTNHIHQTLSYASETRFLEVGFNYLIGKFFFIILVGAVFVWFYKNSKEKLFTVLKNSRLERVAHYILMILIGVFVAYRLFLAKYASLSVLFGLNDTLSTLMLILSFYFSWMFAVAINDIVDVEIDKVTNAERPLCKGSLGPSDMKDSALIFALLALLSGFLAGLVPFFMLLAFSALYYIYSAPPTRFKLVPFFSSFLIGLCCLTAVLAGFFLFAPVKDFSLIPTNLTIGIVVFFFLWSHIRDMKDIEGDKKEGVMTVPVLFGDAWGPRTVAILSSLAYLLVPIFTNNSALFLPAAVAAYANARFILRKPYLEKYIFRTYFVFVIVSLLFIFLL